ncbi:hypothetical protein ACHAXR_003472 [Thalassiosira sp. AJA248-18]
MKSPSSHQQPPRTYLENQDIRCVASPYPTTSLSEGITTPVLSAEMKHVLLERLEKEIMSKLEGGSMCRRGVPSSTNMSGKKRRRESKINAESGVANKAAENVDDRKVIGPMRICTAESVVRSRFIVGINQCTKILERASTQKKDHQQLESRATTTVPSLILLARDVRPATVIAHIAIHARILNVPTLILPGKASVELGKAVGIRSVAVAAFLPSHGEDAMQQDKEEEREWKEAQNDVNSFVKYVISKIPK